MVPKYLHCLGLRHTYYLTVSVQQCVKTTLTQTEGNTNLSEYNRIQPKLRVRSFDLRGSRQLSGRANQISPVQFWIVLFSVVSSVSVHF